MEAFTLPLTTTGAVLVVLALLLAFLLIAPKLFKDNGKDDEDI